MAREITKGQIDRFEYRAAQLKGQKAFESLVVSVGRQRPAYRPPQMRRADRRRRVGQP